MSTTKRPPQNAGLIKSDGIYLRFFGFCKGGEILLYPPVINAKELVRAGSHVDIVRFALCPFLVHKSVNGIISRDSKTLIPLPHTVR